MTTASHETLIANAISEQLDRVDPFADLSPQEFDSLRGKALAINPITGELIEFAPTRAELKKIMAGKHPSREWAHLTGPPYGEPINAEDLP